MLALQVVEKQVEYNETNLMFIFSRKIRVAARLLCHLFIARAADGTCHNVKRVTRVLIDS